VTSVSQIIVALDFNDTVIAERFVERLEPCQCRLKVGKELFTHAGPQFVERLVAKGFDVFLDLKYHDIPNTVARACAIAADLGVWMLNVHALGGTRMMAAAKEALEKVSNPPLLVAVTVLTSLTEADLHEVGIRGSTEEAALRLAELACRTRLNGVVCSAKEVRLLRERFGSSFLLVTPGIRPVQPGNGDDQRRVTTPAEAVNAGASYLVVGRPVTQADDPLRVLLTIEQEISSLI